MAGALDVIQSCLALAPVPYLGPAFGIFKFIWDSIQAVQGSREQLKAFAEAIAKFLATLDREARRGSLNLGTQAHVADLEELDK